jgi:ribosomal protein S18 acetylase RimI-like enzyme
MPRIEPLESDALDRLESLWLELHAHHQAVAPQLAPYVADEASWAVRRALYETTLADGGFALVAREGESDVGYALVAIEPPHWPATFVTSHEIAELLTLAVRSDQRGRGVGSALLDAVDTQLSEDGHDDREIGVVPSNVRAVALYERLGYVPTWLTLTRFARPRSAPAESPAVPVEAVAVDAVDALAPLWHSLHHHHQAIAPALGPFVPHDASWEIVRDLLRASARDGLLLRAGLPTSPLAMARVSVARDDPLWADTWATGRDVAEIRLLVVAEGARGTGLGTALLDAIDARLASTGITDQVVGAIAPNAAAIRLYERRDFRPAWLQMTRFAARG